MREILVTAFILFLVTGLPCIVLAYLIGLKQRTDLLAGFYGSSCKDVKGLTKAMGFGMLVLGAGPTIVFVLWSLHILTGLAAIVSLVCLIMLPIFLAYYAQLKFIK